MKNSDLFCESVDYLIKNCNLQIDEIASLLNVDTFTLIKWRNHQQSPSAKDILSLSRIVQQYMQKQVLNIDRLKILDTIENLDNSLILEFNDEIDDIKQILDNYLD